MAMTESVQFTARRAPFGAITIFKIVDVVYDALAGIAGRQVADVRTLTPALREDIGVTLADLEAPSPLGRVVARVSDWYMRRRTIAELSALSDRQLADIGMTRSDIHNI